MPEREGLSSPSNRGRSKSGVVKVFNALRLALPAVCAGLLSVLAPVQAEETVNLYNWNDYVAPDTLP